MLNQIETIIKNNQSFLISCHIGADGDAISSSLAIMHILDYLKKDYRLILHDEFPDERFNYLNGFNKIEWAKNVSNFSPDAAIICDTPTVERMGESANFLPKNNATIIKLDHHPSDDHFGFVNWEDLNSSSTTCIVYKIMEHLNVPVSADLAQIVMSGLMYDTGRFSYENTKAIDFEIAAKMLTAGAQPAIAYKKIFAESSLVALKTIGKGLSSIEAFFNNQVVIIYLDYDSIKDSQSGEIEELASLTTFLRGAHVGLFVREAKPNFFKVSLRSTGNVNVNQLAAAFGGGGHKKASGCKFDGVPIKEIKEKLLAEAERQLKIHQYL